MQTAQASALQEGVIKDLVLLSCVGVHPVFVHGGGPEINTWLDKLGIQHQFKNGLRVTDGAAQDATRCLALCGQREHHDVSRRHHGCCGDGARRACQQGACDPDSAGRWPSSRPVREGLWHHPCTADGAASWAAAQKGGCLVEGSVPSSAGGRWVQVEKEIGFVGEVTSVDASLLRTLVDSDYIPVVASVAADTNGQALNVNADIAAGEVLPSTS